MNHSFAVESAKLRVPPTFLCWLSALLTHAVGVVPLLKLLPETNNIDIIYFNIGTLFLQDGLSKPLSDDGKLTVENFHKLQSAIISYEKVLKINPLNKLAKFNLSILYSSMPDKPSEIISDKAVQELSNIPIGLP